MAVIDNTAGNFCSNAQSDDQEVKKAASSDPQRGTLIQTQLPIGYPAKYRGGTKLIVFLVFILV